MTKEQLTQHLVTLTAALESGRLTALRIVFVDGNHQAAHTEWSASPASRLLALVDSREWSDAQLAVEGRVAAHFPRN